MARNSDIRVYIPTLFPRATANQVISVLKDIVTESEKPNPSTVLINKEHYLIRTTEHNKITIGEEDATYVLTDIRRALGECRLLAKTVRRDDMFFLRLLFKNPAKYHGFIQQLGGEEEAAKLSAKAAAAIIRRLHNWERTGSNNSMSLIHTTGLNKDYVINVPKIYFLDDIPHAEVAVVNNDKVYYHEVIKLNIPIKLNLNAHLDRVERFKNEYDLSYTLFHNLTQVLGQERTGYLLGLLTSMLSAYQTKGNYPNVTIELDNKRNRLHCRQVTIGDQALLEIKLHYNKTIVELTRHLDVTAAELIIGYNIIRQYFSFDYIPELGSLNKEIFNIHFFKENNKSIFNRIKATIDENYNIGKGNNTATISVGGCHLTQRHWVNGKTYYAVDCLVNGEIYCFEQLFDLDVFNTRHQPGQKGNIVRRLISKIF